MDADTYTSSNKRLTRIIEGLGIVGFGITGLLLSEQRKNEEADEKFKGNLLSILQQIDTEQSTHKSLNQEKLLQLQKSIHMLQSQAGRKKKGK